MTDEKNPLEVLLAGDDGDVAARVLGLMSVSPRREQFDALGKIVRSAEVEHLKALVGVRR